MPLWEQSHLPHITIIANLKDWWAFKEVIQNKKNNKKHISVATIFLKVIQIP